MWGSFEISQVKGGWGEKTCPRYDTKRQVHTRTCVKDLCVICSWSLMSQM